MVSLNDHWPQIIFTLCVENRADRRWSVCKRRARKCPALLNHPAHEPFSRRRLGGGSLSGSTSCSLFRFIAIIVRHVSFSSLPTFRITGRVIERSRLNFVFFRTSMFGCTCV